MKALITLTLTAMLWGIAVADEPATREACTTESVEAKAGSICKVDVLVENADTLIALQVPISYRAENAELSCDSVTFQGTRLENQTASFSRIEPESKIAFIAFLSMSQLDPTKPMLNPGKGPIATLWFTVGKDSKPGKVKLDSGSHVYLPHEWIDYSYHFWTVGDEEDMTKEVDCPYEPGYITIK